MSLPMNQLNVPASTNQRYAWMVLAVSFLTLFLAQGSRISYGMFMEPLIAEFGWTRTAASLPATINLLVYAITQPFIGNMVDAWGPRKVILVSLLLLGFGQLAASFTSSLWLFVLLLGLVSGLGVGGSGTVPTSVLVSQWFDQRRGFAMGVCSAGISLGQMVLAPVIVLVVSTAGWRIGLGMLGLLILCFNLPLVRWGLRGDNTRAADNVTFVGSWREVGKAVRAYPFWAGMLPYFTCGFTVFFVYGHLALYARDLGFSMMLAGLAFSLVAAVSILGTVVMGSLADRWDTSYLLAINYFSRSLGFFVLAFAVSNSLMLVVGAAVIGVSFLATIPLTALQMRQQYSPLLMGTFYGLASAAHQFGAALGTMLGGMSFDMLGGYQVILAGGGIMLVFASLLSFSLGKRKVIWDRENGKFIPVAQQG